MNNHNALIIIFMVLILAIGFGLGALAFGLEILTQF